jgi:hypothetical protein
VALCCVLFVGCAYKVDVTSVPPGALVSGPREQVISTPGTLRVSAAPLVRQRLYATSPGYRDMAIDLRYRSASRPEYLRTLLSRPALALGFKRYRQVELVLVPDHGLVGSWDLTDVPKR